jgi:hypothetical protein
MQQQHRAASLQKEICKGQRNEKQENAMKLPGVF